MDVEGALVDEQSFQNYMHKVPIWDFLKVDCLEYLAIWKDQKIAAVKKYVHAMKNLDTGLGGHFIISGCKLLFFVILCFCPKSFFCYLWNF